MSNRVGNTIRFLFNYSGGVLDVVSETAGTALLNGEVIDVGQPSRLRVWELTIAEG